MGGKQCLEKAKKDSHAAAAVESDDGNGLCLFFNKTGFSMEMKLPMSVFSHHYILPLERSKLSYFFLFFSFPLRHGNFSVANSLM